MSLLVGASLTHKFWSECFVVASDIISFLPTTFLHGYSPSEVLL